MHRINGWNRCMRGEQKNHGVCREERHFGVRQSMALRGMQLLLSVDVDCLLPRLGVPLLDAPALLEDAREQDLEECHRGAPLTQRWLRTSTRIVTPQWKRAPSEPSEARQARCPYTHDYEHENNYELHNENGRRVSRAKRGERGNSSLHRHEHEQGHFLNTFRRWSLLKPWPVSFRVCFGREISI